MQPVALSREQILALDDCPTEFVEVPEWGGGVYVRTMGGDERDEFEASNITDGPDGKTRLKSRAEQMRSIRARLVALCAVDAQGERLFTEEDIAALGKRSGKALDRVFQVALRLSGLTKGDVEDLAGN